MKEECDRDEALKMSYEGSGSFEKFRDRYLEFAKKW